VSESLYCRHLLYSVITRMNIKTENSSVGKWVVFVSPNCAAVSERYCRSFNFGSGCKYWTGRFGKCGNCMTREQLQEEIDIKLLKMKQLGYIEEAKTDIMD